MKDNFKLFLMWAFMLGVAFAAGYVLRKEQDEDKEPAKKLKENVDIVSRYDSIISVKEKQLLDSIKAVRKSLNEAKKLQHDENRKLRQRNEALEKRFRDLDLSDRPDF